MRLRYLLRHLLQAILFAILLMYMTDNKTYLHFLLFTVIFAAVNLGIDFIYGRLIDRRIKNELSKIDREEPKE